MPTKHIASFCLAVNQPDPSSTNRSIGFPRSTTGTGIIAPVASSSLASAPTGQAVPKPANRNKGRWFVTLVMGSLFAFLGHLLWTEFAKYRAYGEVRGQVIELSPLTDGTLLETFVTTGQHVEKGQLLSRLDDYELRRERIRLRKEIELAYANLRVRLAETQNLKRNAISDQTDKQVEYFRLLGEFHASTSRIEELRRVYRSNQELFADSVIPEADLLASKSEVEVQQAMLRDMKSAIETLKSSLTQLSKDSFTELVEAEMSRIEPIEQGLQEIEEISRASEIRAPVAGKILRHLKRDGEFVRKSDTVFALLEESSTEAVVFLPQQDGRLLQPGDKIRLFVKTLGETHTFRVDRVASHLVTPPETIKTGYRANKVVVEVFSRPDDSEFTHELSSWIGSEVALPRFGYSLSVVWQIPSFITQWMRSF